MAAQNRTERSATRSRRPTSELLADLRATASDGRDITLGAITAAAEGRIHGLLLVVLGLPETIPMVGFSLLTAIPIAAVAVSLLLYGPQRPLPAALLARSLPRHILDRALDFALPRIRRLETVIHPRWPGIADRERAFGGLTLVAAVILGIPMPGANWLAGVTVVLTGLGLLQRDGAVLLAAVVTAGLSLTLLILMVTGTATIVASGLPAI